MDIDLVRNSTKLNMYGTECKNINIDFIIYFVFGSKIKNVHTILLLQEKLLFFFLKKNYSFFFFLKNKKKIKY